MKQKKKIKNIKFPILIINASKTKKDKIVPFYMGEKFIL